MTSEGSGQVMPEESSQATLQESANVMPGWNWKGSYGPGRAAQSFRQVRQSESGQTNMSLNLPESRPGAWESTARKFLFECDEGTQGSAGSVESLSAPRSARRPHWGGMLPGDTSDVNHGDLTRGGLDQRGVNLTGLDQPEAAFQSGGPAHVMPSHVVTERGQGARVWGDREGDPSPVGSLRTGGWMSDTRFIYGGQEPGDVQRQEQQPARGHAAPGQGGQEPNRQASPVRPETSDTDDGKDAATSASTRRPHRHLSR